MTRLVEERDSAGVPFLSRCDAVRTVTCPNKLSVPETVRIGVSLGSGEDPGRIRGEGNRLFKHTTRPAGEQQIVNMPNEATRADRTPRSAFIDCRIRASVGAYGPDP
jgi:hypothetical protein